MWASITRSGEGWLSAICHLYFYSVLFAFSQGGQWVMAFRGGEGAYNFGQY